MAEVLEKPKNILEVPLEADGEVVTFDLDSDLPEDPSEICVLLENEKCAVEYWLAIATAYARNTHVESGIEVVQKCLEVTAIPKADSELIALNTCLAWLYINLSTQAPVSLDENDIAQGVKTKTEYHNLANDSANQAYKLDRLWSVNLLTRGKLCLDISNYDQALGPFQEVLKQSMDTNLVAQLGKAQVLYHKKNYRAALQTYQRVLMNRPDFKPDPRIGVGLCFWKLGDREGAYEAWNRALELDPENESINTLLGLLHMTNALEHAGASDFSDSYTRALTHAQKAYKANKNYASSNVLLASYFYSKKSPENVFKLSKNALKYSDVPSIISDAYFWMARGHHSLDDLDRALEYYQLAIDKSKNSHLPALIGKSLIQMAQDSPEALLTLENVVNSFPRSTEALLLLGLLTAVRAGVDPKRKQRAITLLERYLTVCKNQDEPVLTEALIALARLYEDSNIEKAEGYLSTALEDLDDGSAYEVAELRTNIGVFQYFRGNYESAAENFEKALDYFKQDTTKSGETSRVTVLFNLARLYDAWGQPDKAIELYKEVLAIAPGYLDAKIRLTYLSVVLDTDGDNGVVAIKDLMQTADDNLEVRSLYGWWLRRQKRTAAKNINEDIEQRHYKHSLVDVNKHDTYSLVAMGNIYLTSAREVRVHKPGDSERKDKLYFKASEFFDKALQIDPRNAYAAQGIAIIFAETKKPELALNIFSKIRETIQDITIYINLGHCFAELRQFAKAIEAYEYALKHYGSGANDAQLMTLLGRVWYARGLSEKNLVSLKKGLEYATEALKKSPDNVSSKFNVAFLQFQVADLVRKLPESKRSSADISDAISGLEEAVESLNELSKVSHPPFPSSDLEQRALMGQNTLHKQLDRALEDQEAYESKMKSKIEEALRIREEEKRKKEEEEAAKRQAQEEHEKKLLEERLRLQEEAREWTESARLQAEEEAAEAARAAEEKKTKKSSDDGSRKAKSKKSAAKDGSEKPARSSRKKYKSDDIIVDDDTTSEEEDAGAFKSDKSDDEDANIDTTLFGDDDDDGNSDAQDGGKESESFKRPSEDDDEVTNSPQKKRKTNRIVDDEEEDNYDDDEPAASSERRSRRSKVIDDDDDDDEDMA